MRPVPDLLSQLARAVLNNDEARGFRRVRWEPEHAQARPPWESGWHQLTVFGGIDFGARVRFVRPEQWPVSDVELAQRYLTICRQFAADKASGGRMMRHRVPYRRPFPPPWPRIPGPPHYFLPLDAHEHYVRVDFRECYARLYLAVTPDCHYRPERPAFLSGRIDWLRRDEWLAMKRPRNIAWGLMCPRIDRLHNTYKPRPTFAPHLAAFVMDCLAAIAADARECFGAVEWSGNDSVVLPRGAEPDFREWVEGEWSMKLHDPVEVFPRHGQVPTMSEAPSPQVRAWLAETWRWCDATQAAHGSREPGHLRAEARAG